MTLRSTTLRTLAVAALALAATAAPAAEPAAIHNAKTVGAMAFETRGRITGPADIVRQGGFAAAATARWIPTPAPVLQASAF